ncbi:MAG: hypothetical protein JNK29_03375 [Anaerolineales bacterium]|nr:hypothetical protein [Anaerolineales bacterium]
MTSYAETPYPRLAYCQCHPDPLATIGILLSLEPASVAACRVLEIGGGSNLTPRAEGLPGSRFSTGRGRDPAETPPGAV